MHKIPCLIYQENEVFAEGMTDVRMMLTKIPCERQDHALHFKDILSLECSLSTLSGLFKKVEQSGQRFW